MKKIVLALIALSIVSCKKETSEKPEHLISENEMTDILYDIALLQAMKSYNTVSLTEKGIDSRTYIYKKYKIDSLTLAQNHAYYAADLKKYDEITKKVTERIKEQKKKTSPNKPGNSPASSPTSGVTTPPATPENANEANHNRQLPMTPVSRK